MFASACLLPSVGSETGGAGGRKRTRYGCGAGRKSAGPAFLRAENPVGKMRRGLGPYDRAQSEHGFRAGIFPTAIFGRRNAREPFRPAARGLFAGKAGRKVRTDCSPGTFRPTLDRGRQVDRILGDAERLGRTDSYRLLRATVCRYSAPHRS